MIARIEMLEKLGFTSKFNLSNDKLKSNESNNIYSSQQVKFAQLYQSISDSEKSFDIYAIQTVNGERGLLLNQITVNSEISTIKFISEMLNHPQS
ncbi:MAG: hypothetical protein H7239_06690 [Flavobacterium sp.]|nr:hypothetical protein [Flavobacterium sp.]